MKKKSMSNNKTFSLFLALCLLFSFSIISCDNVLEDDIQNDAAAKTERSDNTETPDATKGYLKIKFLDTVRKSARTVSPVIDLTRLTDIRLQGSLDGNPEYDKNWDSVSAIEASPLAFERGSWSFTLSATYDGFSFSDTKTATIVLGQTSSISFELATTATDGGLDIKVHFNGDADKAEWSLMSYPGNSVFKSGVSTYNEGDEKIVEYIKDFTSPIPAGTYRFVIDFYKIPEGGTDSDKNKLNTYSEIINIRSGFTSKAERTITLNDLHTISYVMNGGIPASTPGTALPEIYSAQDTAVTLADLEKEGYEFKGWYTGENGAGNKITKVPDNALANADVVLHAHFTIINYTITYNNMTGASYLAGQSNPETYTINDNITFNNPVKNHYTFMGWFTGDNGTGTQKTEISAGETGDIPLYAYWRPDPKVIVTPGFPGDYKVGWKLIKDSTSRDIEIVIKAKNEADVTTNTLNVNLYIGGTFIKDYSTKRFTYPNFLPDPTDSSFLVEFSVAPTDSTTTYTYEYYPQRLYLGSKAPSVAKEVGDVVFNDGSAEPYVDGMTFTTDQKNTVAGIVFYTGDDTDIGNRVLVAALDSTSKSLIKNDTNIINAFDNFIFDSHNGKLSMSEVKASTEWSNAEVNYPGFYWADTYDMEINNKSEWYIPADSELKKLLSIKDTISAACTALGKNTIIQNGMYFSSTKSPGYSGYVKTYQKSLTAFNTQASTSSIICLIQEL